MPVTTQEDPPTPEGGFTPRMMVWVNRLLKWLRGNRVVQGLGITITDAPGGGKLISAEGAGAGTNDVCELFASKFSNTKITVSFGRINGRQPARFAGKSSVQMTVSGTSYLYAYADYDIGTGQWTGADIVLNASPTLANTGSRVYVQIGSCIKNGDELTVNGTCGPVSMDTCGLVI